MHRIGFYAAWERNRRVMRGFYAGKSRAWITN